MRIFSVLAVALLCQSNFIAFSQDDIASQNTVNGYTIIPQPDGSVIYEQINSGPVDPAKLSPRELLLLARFQKTMAVENANSGCNLLLNRFNIDQVNALVDLELTENQRDEIESTKRWLKKSLSDNPHDELNLKVQAVEKIRFILLPEQLNSISGASLRIGELFKFIQGQRVAAYLNLTENQITQIDEDCRRANDALLKAILSHQKLLEEKRSELLDILHRLDEGQIKKLSGLLGRPLDDAFFDSSDLQFMYQITSPRESSPRNNLP